MNAPLYQHGKFIGDLDGAAHDSHLAICAFLNRQNADDAEQAVLDFRVAAGEAREVAAAVLAQFPWKHAQKGAALREAFERELRDVWSEDPASSETRAPDARKPRAYLDTLQFSERSADGPGYVVKGLLSRQSYAVAYGPPGSGKTFAFLDLAYAVAQGRDWMGLRVRGGIVVYVPFEGGGGLAKRVQALVQKYGHAPNFRVIENPDYNLRELAGRRAFAADMAAALHGEKPVLFVFDTLARALKGGDENAAKEIGALNDALAALIENTGACALMLHHTGKDASAGARGSSALLGAIDTEIKVDSGALVPTKQRDCDLGAPIGFKLATVAVGVDSDGDDITSCVVEQAAAGASGKRKLTGLASDAFKALCKIAPTNEPVTAKAWREAFAAIAYPTDPPSADTQRTGFKRACKALIAGDWIIPAGNDTWQRKMEGGSDG